MLVIARSETTKQSRSNFLFYSQGFGLLEIMAAFFILSFALLGMLGIYIYSFKEVRDSFGETLAFSHLISMREDPKECLTCENLLPESECNCGSGSVSLCWGMDNNRRCLKL